jgi:hypothetical protein
MVVGVPAHSMRIGARNRGSLSSSIETVLGAGVFGREHATVKEIPQ